MPMKTFYYYYCFSIGLLLLTLNNRKQSIMKIRGCCFRCHHDCRRDCSYCCVFGSYYTETNKFLTVIRLLYCCVGYSYLYLFKYKLLGSGVLMFDCSIVSKQTFFINKGCFQLILEIRIRAVSKPWTRLSFCV